MTLSPPPDSDELFHRHPVLCRDDVWCPVVSARIRSAVGLSLEAPLLVLYVPDTESGRATLRTFRASLDDRMEDVLDRDLLVVPVGDLPRPDDVLRPAVDVGAAGRSHVRRRFDLQGREFNSC